MARKLSFLSSNISDAILAAAREMGYDNLRENQIKVLSFFLGGRDTFVSLPTGSGKSLCYCILPLANDFLRRSRRSSLVIVVSPLVALMKDQVRAMTERNVSAVYVGEVSEEEDDGSLATAIHMANIS